MVKGAVFYRGSWLAPGSLALELHANRKFPELDKHLKELDQKERDLIARYGEKK